MSSPFQGIDTAKTALIAFQSALDVTGQNVSNVNTAGYSRETVSFNENVPTELFQTNPLFIGNGVSVQSVNRVQDAFLQQRMLGAQSDLGRSTSLSTTLNQVQSLLPEPNSGGISDGLTAFFGAWSALGSNPGDPASQEQVQQAGSTLADRIRGTYAGLQTQASQAASQVTGTFQDIDNLTTQIAQLNDKIKANIGGTGNNNELLDQRDQAVQQLSKLVDVKTYTFSDGTMAVYMNQLTLVDSSGAKAIPTNYDPTTQTVTDGSSKFNVNGGQLAGLFQSINSIKGYEGQLDTLANTLRTQVNTIYGSGINAQGQTGQKFFNDVASGPQTGAIDFDLDPGVAADPGAIASGTSGAAGDGGMALSLSNLSNAQLVPLGNATFSGYYSGFVSTVGRDASNASSLESTQAAVVTQVTSQIQSTSGVSVDEEMANMLRYQESYQAAAKALTMFDQTTQDLLGILP